MAGIVATGGSLVSHEGDGLSTTAVIRRYVELGFGIGIVPGLPRRTPSKSLHERSMSTYFGRVPVYLISRRGGLHQKSIQAFAETIKSMLNPRAKAGKKK